MTKSSYKYLFGPVPSRRLGRSLGVDIIPFKTCTQNCIYCQLGKNAPQTIERKEYVPVEAVLDELKRKIAEGLAADTVTFSGSGEPTLHSGLGQLIDAAKRLTDLPVVIITNGTLLSRSDVRQDCAKADIVMPSLDAGDAETFQKINHPHPDLHYSDFVEGLCQFRKEFSGQLWLEVFFCECINTDSESIRKLKEQIDCIKPDKIQLNTAVRPVTDPAAVCVSPEKMSQIARQFGDSAIVIAGYHNPSDNIALQTSRQEILALLRRRPCSMDDICSGLHINHNLALKLIQQLLNHCQIDSEVKNEVIYYKIR